MSLGFFRRRIVFQQQTTNGGFGQAGAAGATGPAGPAGAAGATGAAGLGPTQQEDRDSAAVVGAFVTPLEGVTAVPGSKLVPLMFWTECNVTVAGTNACAFQWGYPGVGALASYSAHLNQARNTGGRDVPNLTTENAAINTALPSTGQAIQIALSVAPTGSPTATARTWCLYFAVPALIP